MDTSNNGQSQEVMQPSESQGEATLDSLIKHPSDDNELGSEPKEEKQLPGQNQGENILDSLIGHPSDDAEQEGERKPNTSSTGSLNERFNEGYELNMEIETKRELRKAQTQEDLQKILNECQAQSSCENKGSWRKALKFEEMKEREVWLVVAENNLEDYCNNRKPMGLGYQAVMKYLLALFIVRNLLWKLKAIGYPIFDVADITIEHMCKLRPAKKDNQALAEIWMEASDNCRDQGRHPTPKELEAVVAAKFPKKTKSNSATEASEEQLPEATHNSPTDKKPATAGEDTGGVSSGNTEQASSLIGNDGDYVATKQPSLKGISLDDLKVLVEKKCSEAVKDDTQAKDFLKMIFAYKNDNKPNLDSAIKALLVALYAYETNKQWKHDNASE